MMTKKTILDFRKMKKQGEKVTMLSAYDFPMAQFAERAGMDIILVGDSLGNCVYGYPFGTLPVTLDQSIAHTAAVRRGAPNTFVIGDMPFGSYQASSEEAVRNAVRFYKEAGVDAIKPEGGRRVTNVIKALSDAGMVVMAHIGLTPQSSGQLGGYKAQGRTAESAHEIILDARAVEEAGASLLILEAVTPEVGQFIAQDLDIPVFGIGAGPYCDGQLLLVYDLLGIWEAFQPKFVKRYAHFGEEAVQALQEYVKDVHEGTFPGPEHCYKMIEGEQEKLKRLLTPNINGNQVG
jgi:3-methyl-2-oxobutanoate hydroxymethyltransferase